MNYKEWKKFTCETLGICPDLDYDPDIEKDLQRIYDKARKEVEQLDEKEAEDK